jgi:uncharacterized Zn-binding protein involved in type VI secretion
MKILLLVLAAFPNLAHACEIYNSANLYQGDMVTTGTMYVGVFPGASDSTPYAGDIRPNGVVSQGERNPQRIATVSGSQLFDLNGKLIAVVEGGKITNSAGTLIATARDQYTASKLCVSPAVALAGAALFILFPQPNPGP